VGTRLTSSVSRIRRGGAIAAVVLSIVGLVVFAASDAGAAPQPTVAQVQARINQLTTQFNEVTEELDQASQQLSAAQTRLAQVRVEFRRADTRFQVARAYVAQIAAAAFEDTGATSIAGVLTAGNPTVVLQQGAMLEELSGSRNAETQQLLTDASQLGNIAQEQQRTEYGIASLRGQLAARKNSLRKLLIKEKDTLAGLTATQQQTVENNSIGANGSTTVTYTGPTSTQGDKAVEFVYDQLGCTYVYGATGPCEFGYDCSGLAQAAWASAGVAIPRDTFDQWAALPHIPSSAIEPGDLLYYNGESHVAMYVGDGYIIDAPETGLDVERIPMDTPWYADNFDGAVSP
jgi:peptidoglycan DL-endopeptidase CwlO